VFNLGFCRFTLLHRMVHRCLYFWYGLQGFPIGINRYRLSKNSRAMPSWVSIGVLQVLFGCLQFVYGFYRLYTGVHKIL
jgi:hypothetical protein